MLDSQLCCAVFTVYGILCIPFNISETNNIKIVTDVYFEDNVRCLLFGTCDPLCFQKVHEHNLKCHIFWFSFVVFFFFNNKYCALFIIVALWMVHSVCEWVWIKEYIFFNTYYYYWTRCKTMGNKQTKENARKVLMVHETLSISTFHLPSFHYCTFKWKWTRKVVKISAYYYYYI